MAPKIKNFINRFIFVTQILGFSAFAAVQKPHFVELGQRQIGGQAGAGFSLLNLERLESKTKKHERLIFSVGTRDGQSLKGTPGYFNAQYRKNRIVIDFAQMPFSRLDEKQIKKILKDSSLIQNAKLSQDPLDKTLTLILDLKNPVQIKALQIKGEKQTAKVVIDILKK